MNHYIFGYPWDRVIHQSLWAEVVNTNSRCNSVSMHIERQITQGSKKPVISQIFIFKLLLWYNLACSHKLWAPLNYRVLLKHNFHLKIQKIQCFPNPCSVGRNTTKQQQKLSNAFLLSGMSYLFSGFSPITHIAPLCLLHCYTLVWTGLWRQQRGTSVTGSCWSRVSRPTSQGRLKNHPSWLSSKRIIMRKRKRKNRNITDGPSSAVTDSCSVC